MNKTYTLILILIYVTSIYAFESDADNSHTVFEEVLEEIRSGNTSDSKSIENYKRYLRTENNTLDKRIKEIKSQYGGDLSNLYQYQLDTYYFSLRCQIEEMKDQEKRDQENCLSGGKETKDSFEIFTGEIISTSPQYLGEFNGPHLLKYPFYYIRPKNFENKLPLVILSPPISGMRVNVTHGVIPRMSRTLAENGIASIIMLIDEDLMNEHRPLEDIDGWMIRQVKARRAMLDFIENEKTFQDIDTEKIGVMGVSLGGIQSILLMATEPTRIKAGVVAVAGGNFPYLWPTSSQDTVIIYRNNQRSKKDSNIAEEISRWCTSDPIYYKDTRNFRNDILMFAATKDSKVRPFTQLSLWETLGKPQAYRIKGKGKVANNHKYHILQFATFESDRWVPFFKNKFGINY